jgi:hypothetical protein
MDILPATIVEHLPAISPEVTHAIYAVREEVSNLIKTGWNEKGRYPFVSIDQFYEKVGAASAKAGIWWHPIETDVQPWSGGDFVMFRYAFTLTHTKGGTYTDFARVTVFHPLEGPQTTGSAMSYAEKVFMRMLFKIPSGEADGDNVPPRRRGMYDEPLGTKGGITINHATEPMDDRQKLEESRPVQQDGTYNLDLVADLDRLERDMTEFSTRAGSIAALTAYWQARKPNMRQLLISDGARFSRIQSRFSARKAEFEKKAIAQN